MLLSPSSISVSPSIADSLVYATYLSGSDDKDDIGYGIAVDNSGYAYVTGTTASADFPIALEEAVPKGGKDAFMVTLDASGSGALSPFFIWAANKDDEGRGIALRGGMIYITGHTSSTETDFPLKNSLFTSPAPPPPPTLPSPPTPSFPKSATPAASGCMGVIWATTTALTAARRLPLMPMASTSLARRRRPIFPPPPMPSIGSMAAARMPLW